ncbi:hypothetical protein LEP1GSC050_3762 [Leptospira broomii serovar Hurstbridge str. 5399]|uniref:Outer membrane protein, TIGR04327 family n=1 Tax=Leptospira broomii serovar Hurstbridge str. 5399 TaxID=1049789 RepID=T0F4T4_9LEPT|nr:cell envelope integrity protein TolA [Leptospira broomii]EQA46080.1 hypothetical protein LEP1GSC050_3762 [Leptospira broomii serovar Hurstbridge str. 5399]
MKGEIINHTATAIQLKLPDGNVVEIIKTSILRISFRDAPPPKQEEKVGPSPEELEAARKLEEENAAKLAEDAKRNALLEEKKAKRQKEIDDSKRHSLEFYTGFGQGSYHYQTLDYYEKFSNFVALTNNGKGPIFGSPQTKGKAPLNVSIRYSLNRLVLEAGGVSFQNTVSQTSPGMVNTAGPSSPNQPLVAQGTFPESYKQIYAQISYSVYPHPKYDVRPILGYQSVWQKSSDTSTYAFSPAISGTNNLTEKRDMIVADHLHGPSFGIAFDTKLGEKWETRMEIQSYSLKGDSQGNFNNYSTISGPSSNTYSSFDSFRLLNEWSAKGSSISGKLIYKWKYGIRFWAGFQSTRIQYALKSTQVEITQNNPAPPDQLLLQEILVNSITQGYAGASTTSAIFFGVGYSLDFKK